MPLQPGSVPDFLWTLSEAGFTGLLGIFRIAGDRLMPVQRILFAWSERGRLQRDDYLGCATQPGSVPDFLWTLSEAGFTGLLGIFWIAGERLLPVERILFAWSERADCRGTIIWDAPRGLGLSQISWWTLSEAGFTGFLGIFGIAGDRLMPVERILFAWSERADCRGTIIWGCTPQPGSVPDFLWTLSEAGFTGLLGIFRIAGERLLPVWRILFESGERADCRGTIIWDAPRSLGLCQILGGRCLKQDLQDYWGFSGLQAVG